MFYSDLALFFGWINYYFHPLKKISLGLEWRPTWGLAAQVGLG